MLVQVLLQKFIEESPGRVLVLTAIENKEPMLVTNCPVIPMIGAMHDHGHLAEGLSRDLPDGLGGLRRGQGFNNLDASGMSILEPGHDYILTTRHSLGIVKG